MSQILDQFDQEAYRLIGQYIDETLDLEQKIEKQHVLEDYNEILDIAEQEQIIGDCLDFEKGEEDIEQEQEQDLEPEQPLAVESSPDVFRQETETQQEEQKQDYDLPPRQFMVSPKFIIDKRFQFRNNSGAPSPRQSSNPRSSVTGGRGQLLFGGQSQENHVYGGFQSQQVSLNLGKKNPFKRNTYITTAGQSIHDEGKPPLAILVSQGSFEQINLGQLKVVKNTQKQKGTKNSLLDSRYDKFSKRTSIQLEYAKHLKQPKNLLTYSLDQRKYLPLNDTFSVSNKSETSKKLKRVSNQNVTIQIEGEEVMLTKNVHQLFVVLIDQVLNILDQDVEQINQRIIQIMTKLKKAYEKCIYFEAMTMNQGINYASLKVQCNDMWYFEQKIKDENYSKQAKSISDEFQDFVRETIKLYSISNIQKYCLFDFLSQDYMQTGKTLEDRNNLFASKSQNQVLIKKVREEMKVQDMQTPPLNSIEVAGGIRGLHKILQNTVRQIQKIEKFVSIQVIKDIFDSTQPLFDLTSSNPATQEYFSIIVLLWTQYFNSQSDFLVSRFINSDDALNSLRLNMIKI